METEINWQVNTIIIRFDDGKEIELSYNEFEELRKLLNEVENANI